MNLRSSETIAAISTPSVNSGISIIRISGSLSYEILKKLTKRNDFVPRYMYLSSVYARQIVDKALTVFFKGPNSYTGEDMAEIQCHGNVVVASEILSACISLGAKTAFAGEFTRRAFLNGKMDLSQAEGVIELIEAESVNAIKAASEVMNGALGKEIKEIEKELTAVTAHASVALDYPEEGIEEIEISAINKAAEEQIKKLEILSNSYNTGRLIKNGVRVAIFGSPNVGKSKLLNSLTGQDRAIVTDIAGTTRDTVEESYIYKDVKFNLIDTAGIRESSDTVESKGIERSKAALKTADVILFVVDGDNSEDKTQIALDEIKEKTVIKVRNKLDLIKGKEIKITDADIFISAETGENLNELKEKIFSACLLNVYSGGATVTNIRHKELIDEAKTCLSEALNGGAPLDCIISDLMNALRALGEITGATATEEVIDKIFSSFCVGK